MIINRKGIDLVTQSVRMPDDLASRLDEVAKSTKRTKSSFIIEALEAKLRSDAEGPDEPQEPAWMRFAGAAPRGVRKEIDAIVEEEFSAVDPELWK